MAYRRERRNYDKSPVVQVSAFNRSAKQGWQALVEQIKAEIACRGLVRCVLTLESYHGVALKEVEASLIEPLNPDRVLFADEARLDQKDIDAMLARFITDDRVFGYLAPHKLNDFFSPERLNSLRHQIASIKQGLIIVAGTGASLIHQGDIRIYADMPRWEIQQRFRRGELDNWGAGNFSEDILRRYKRAYFIEWRVFDRFKVKVLPQSDFYLDTSKPFEPVLVDMADYLSALKKVTSRPFRLVPFFDEGVWGGQWMKDVCRLDRQKENYAWGFDCVPEENSLNLKFGTVTVQTPAINLVLLEPQALLGNNVHARFGAEFPIRFDFLDTFEGQNLSLQVHPLTEYIQQEFGMHYTQDESYYLLDAAEDARVYLGTKDNIDPQEMISALRAAQHDRQPFDHEKYINRFPAKKHDHFLIPAGTVHCAGSGSLVLEISATPYIFTFKLWDWGRKGLDGLPRPVHIEHGEEAIQWDRERRWVEQNLINQVELLAEGEGWKEERTGLHEREFIETRRHWFSKPVMHNTGSTVNVLNLIEGEEAVVESPTGAFEPFIVHYAETFIIPAGVSCYQIRPGGESTVKTLATIKAFVRG
ncbi:class I mannose-6-phosphate isomerase [Erwinia pyri]|uniref:Class I mannose-6-phosphate isomerase n=1 Tax=Erwinia pyri TaxID=3062598 RepID=A0AA50DF53_9GAMM|nr:class I mannose-6-phosphate isomerase [Erwinia sp. DE2]WLS76959.1 class I mannose-6-phosphate isomerase [Erwinia sp. DE2]